MCPVISPVVSPPISPPISPVIPAIFSRGLSRQVAEMKRWTEKLKQCILCFQTQLADPNLVAICVRYYRLVSRWLVVTANPPPEGLPLSDKVPRLFAALPEFVMNDVAEFLKSVTHLAPQVQERSEQTLTTPRHAHRLRK